MAHTPEQKTETLKCKGWDWTSERVQTGIALVVKKCGDYWTGNWELCCDVPTRRPSGKESKQR